MPETEKAIKIAGVAERAGVAVATMYTLSPLPQNAPAFESQRCRWGARGKQGGRARR